MTLPTINEISDEESGNELLFCQLDYRVGKRDGAEQAYRAVAKELRELIADRACQDFITLKAEVEKIAEHLEGEVVMKGITIVSVEEATPELIAKYLEGEKVTR
jgi:hypothetical protein